MTVDIDKLEELARAAPSSDWYVEEEPDEQGRTIVYMPPGEASYIAATDRKVVLELVQRLRAAEGTDEPGYHAEMAMSREDAEAVQNWAKDAAVRQRLALLEAIVRDLAAKEPAVYFPMGGDWACVLCSDSVKRVSDPMLHDIECPYRRAVEAIR